MKSRLLIIVVLLCAFFVAAAAYPRLFVPASSSDLALEVFAEKTTLRVSDQIKVAASIRNKGSKTVLLVQPGDGSESGMRTPSLKWDVIQFDETSRTAMPVLSEHHRLCGNINPLKMDEIFILQPGGTRKFDEWIPPFTKPGKYKVVLSYANIPSKKWDGILMGEHNPLAMWFVRNSTECLLESNAIIFTVSE